MKAQRLYTLILIAGLSQLTGCLGPQSEEPTLRNSRQPIGDRNQGGGGNGGGGGGNQQQQLNFQQANTILKGACGGTNCHGADAAGLQKYVDSQDNLTNRKDAVLKRIQDGTMPIGGKKFNSDDDKKNLIAYLQNLGNGGGGGGGGGAANFQVANTIMQQACGGANCHSAGANFGVYVDNEENTKKDAQKIINRVSNNSMPISKKYKDPGDKDKLLEYLNSVK